MPGRSLRRVRIAAAARPNSAIIGGAGTSCPPLDPDEPDEPDEDDEDDELLLLELDEDEDEDELLPLDEPLLPEDPNASANRRLSILLMRESPPVPANTGLN